MIYPSKKDWWIALTLLVVSLLEFGSGSILLYAAVVQQAPLPDLLVCFVLILVGGLILWMYVSTGCDISPPELIFRSGPIRFTIPLDAIAEVRQKKKGVGLDLGWHFALSWDRLLIRYLKPNGRMALFSVSVSPEDKEGFLEELAREVPGLRNESEVEEHP